MAEDPRPPLIVHVIDRLVVGGMENGLVNILNHPASRRYRHAIVSLRPATDFRHRIRAPEVELHCIDKRPGKDPAAYVRLWRLLRRLRPSIVHTRNLPVADMVVPAAAALVPVRIHGEHGRDVLEEDGGNAKYNTLRRAVSPLVTAYVAVSQDIASWLGERVGVPAAKVHQITNGVDGLHFHPGARSDCGTIVIGTVGRMQTVKDQPNLARAFVRLVEMVPDGRRRLRLALVGDGPLLAECRAILAEAGMAELGWLPGNRDDVANIMRGFDLFVLPSRTEGISNTILEAMASGLPVVATRVGGNPELVAEGRTGALVPPNDPPALATALAAYTESAALRQAHGTEARRRVEREFELGVMVNRYLDLYDDLLTSGARNS